MAWYWHLAWMFVVVFAFDRVARGIYDLRDVLVDIENKRTDQWRRDRGLKDKAAAVSEKKPVAP